MKSKKLLILIIPVLAIIIVIAALFLTRTKKEVSTTKSVTSKPKETKEKVVTDTAETVSVLTGLPETKAEADRRPYAVMTENTKDAIPQYGLNSSAIVYECPVEGGITRLMAIYESTDGMDRIGNVRSCRPYFPIMASEYDAVYVHYGQSPEGQAVLDSGIVDELNGLSGVGNKVFYRASDKKAPHNAYTSADGLKAGSEKMNFETTYDSSKHEHFKFATEKTPNLLSAGTDARKVSLYFFNNAPYFTYDETTGLYNRFEFGNKQIDAVDGKQITVKNIILENVTSSKYNETKGTLNLGVVGSGSGKYITNGKCIDITWKKASEKEKTTYYDASGKEIVLNPGRTWVSLIEQQYADRNAISATVE